MVDVLNKLTFEERNEESFEDYTAVTDWEVFTQELENVLTSWMIKQDTEVSSVCGRLQFCGNLKFGERIFNLNYYKSCIESEKTKNSTHTITSESVPRSYVHAITPMPDFSGRFIIPLFWFGLSHAFILKPDDGEIKGGTRLSLLLSSVEMAVYATRCPVPVLVEHYGPSYFGLAASSCLKSSDYTNYLHNNVNNVSSSLSTSNRIGSLNIDFTSCRIEGEILANCTHLSGLKEIFLTKLGYPWSVNYPVPKLDISARFIYRLPSWSSLRVDYQNTNSLIFSFDLLQRTSMNLSFNLATTWPLVPSHAITEKPSWKSLKPEGAPICQLQLCASNPFADKMSVRIQRFFKSCSKYEQPVHQMTDISSNNPSSVLSSDSVVQFLLFLFPDADAEGVCNKVLHNELTLSFGDLSIHELLIWKRQPIMNSSEKQKFASIFGLPNPISLIHRLAVIIANLLVYKHYEFNDCLLLINSMFNELYIELQLRYDRLICLPVQILYEEVFNKFNTNNSNEIIEEEEEEASVDENMPPLHAWNHSSIQLINGLKFKDWPIDCYYNLDCILHRFNGCILKARESHQHQTLEVQSDDDDDDDDGDIYFDVSDQTSPSSHDEVKSARAKTNWLDACSRNDALSEAETILDWLKSRCLLDHLHSLLPHIILECMFTFHSLVPHPRLSKWYSSMLKKLDQEIYDLLKIHSSKSANVDTVSKVTKSFPLSTFCDILEIIAEFSIQLTCFNELIYNVILCDYSYMLDSDIFLNFLCKLSNHVILLENITGQLNSWSPSLGGWISLPNTTTATATTTIANGNMKETERDMILKFLKMLFDKSIPNELNSTGEGNFQFTSIPQTWLPPDRPVDLRRPNYELYIFYTELPYPNQLTSRLGSHRLYIELYYDKQSSNYKTLLMAGSFSHDTQFF
ncbi:unnamed protein product [Schistosoma rodhaini]|uniref:Rab3 GTPase-activating protein catalytic subunit n=1 Tax=Schistosoma rodhaini TaxID=6188 RepID=A0AA85ESR1_9TREM|nr:unnamed protein product [Schistosoma rodhaini]